MIRLLSLLAAVALLTGTASPVFSGELKSPAKTPKPKAAAAQDYRVTGVRHSGSSKAAGKPKEIVVVGSKAKKSAGGKTTSTDDWEENQ